ncbi:MAG: hypothetical protein JNM84_03260 [Planctomycetes bacterium]|nr:hypothetical protein [Planctomycetota bacterium]
MLFGLSVWVLWETIGALLLRVWIAIFAPFGEALAKALSEALSTMLLWALGIAGLIAIFLLACVVALVRARRRRNTDPIGVPT